MVTISRPEGDFFTLTIAPSSQERIVKITVDRLGLNNVRLRIDAAREIQISPKTPRPGDAGTRGEAAAATQS